MSKITKINRYFFEQSNELHEKIISLHDFVLPAATALWNFRGVITNELSTNPTITVADLSKKFNTAPSTRGSTNLIVPFRDISWDSQKERLAEIALVNIIALFEIWSEEICGLFGRNDLPIKMQHPSNATRSSGVGFAIDQIINSHNGPIALSIYPSLIMSKKYSILTLDNLLKCFRYFKELRNCFMHRGRRCDGKLYGAQSQFIPIANKTSLGMSFVPEYTATNIGDNISLSLHGVLGFTDVILRIITTVDAELAKAPLGESIIVNRILDTAQTPLTRKSLPAMFNTLGMQGVTLTPDFIAMLKTNNVIQ